MPFNRRPPESWPIIVSSEWQHDESTSRADNIPTSQSDTDRSFQPTTGTITLGYVRQLAAELREKLSKI